MSLSENNSTLPRPDDYTRPMLRLNGDMYHYGHAHHALTDGIGRLKRESPLIAEQVIDTAKHISGLFTVPNSDLDIRMPAGQRIAGNVMHGLMTGVLVAAEMQEGGFPLELGLQEGLSVDVELGDEQGSLHGLIAVGLIEHGDHGLELIGERNRRLLSIWEKEAAVGDDPELRRLYRIGFGMAIVGVYNYLLDIERQRLGLSDTHSDEGL